MLPHSLLLEVDTLGLEPRLFCTKNRRVANYTMGQWVKFKINFGANLTTKFNLISAINKNYIPTALFCEQNTRKYKRIFLNSRYY